jgi:hypothetical protein
MTAEKIRIEQRRRAKALALAGQQVMQKGDGREIA